MQANRGHIATQANERQANGKHTEKEGQIKRQGWSGGEENEMQKM